MHNKFIKLYFTILFLLAISGKSLYAQDDYTIIIDTIKTPRTKTITIVTVRTPPKFILQFNGGINTGAMEMTSQNGIFSRRNLIEGKNFGTRYGYGFNLIGKLPLGKKANFWLDFVTGFDKFSSEMFANDSKEGNVSYTSINNGIGMEYNFTPYHKVKYYLGLNSVFSFISGSSKMINTQENNVIDVSFKSSFRMGYDLFFGVDYSLTKNVGMSFGMKFTHANLLFKDSQAPEATGEGTVLETTINDFSPPDDTDPYLFAGWKQFAYFSTKIGISYYFGVKETRYKLPD